MQCVWVYDVYTHTHTQIHIYIWLCMYEWVCVCVHVCVCMHACVPQECIFPRFTEFCHTIKSAHVKCFYHPASFSQLTWELVSEMYKSICSMFWLQAVQIHRDAPGWARKIIKLGNLAKQGPSSSFVHWHLNTKCKKWGGTVVKSIEYVLRGGRFESLFHKQHCCLCC